MDGLQIADAEVRYGHQVAVTGVSLDVAPGEIVAVIGPSGCGKSTLLRAVAGLEPLAAGAVRWDGRDLHGVAPHERSFGLMFQDHALFPHRDVAENVAFGLKMQHRPRAEQHGRVHELLHLVGLDGFAGRRIDELSGGEAQRVALARSLAPRPRLVMLDEPLGSLDRALRERLAGDIRRAITAIGVAALHVTHDQDEAFTVADRVAVMHAGHLLQVDAPARLWRTPRTDVVARFLGHHVVTAAVAATLGLAPTGAHAVALLPGALVPDPHGPVRGVVRDVRFTSLATRVDVELPAAGVTVPLTVAHGAPAAEQMQAARPGDALALRPHPELASAVEAGPPS